MTLLEPPPTPTLTQNQKINIGTTSVYVVSKQAEILQPTKMAHKLETKGLCLKFYIFQMGTYSEFMFPTSYQVCFPEWKKK